MNGIINVNAKETDPQFCKVWGFVRGHVNLSSFLWPFAFAHAMHCFYNGTFKSQRDLKKAFRYYALLCWIGPIVLSIIPLIMNSYGAGEIYCYIQSGPEKFEQSFYLSILIFYGPVTIIMLFMVFYYIKIVRFIIQNPNNESNQAIYNFFFYPVMVMVTYIFAAANRFINFEGDGSMLWLVKAHIILRQLQGFTDAVIYGFSPKFREQIKKHFGKRSDLEKRMMKQGGTLDSSSSFNDSSSFINISSFGKKSQLISAQKGKNFL